MSAFEKSDSFGELDELIEGTGPGIIVSLLAVALLMLVSAEMNNYVF